MEILVLCIAFGASIVGAICGIGGVLRGNLKEAKAKKEEEKVNG